MKSVNHSYIVIKWHTGFYFGFTSPVSLYLHVLYVYILNTEGIFQLKTNLANRCLHKISPRIHLK